MSVPSDQLMQLVNGGMKGSPPAPVSAPGLEAAQPQGSAPVSAPMSTPEPKQGEKQNAMINISLAQDLLEQTLPAIGSETEEGAVILDVLSKLSKKFGAAARKSKELVPAELMQMMQNLPQMGGMSPEMKALQAGGPPGMQAKPPMQPPMQ
jgi:hypothetical protein